MIHATHMARTMLLPFLQMDQIPMDIAFFEKARQITCSFVAFWYQALTWMTHSSHLH